MRPRYLIAPVVAIVMVLLLVGVAFAQEGGPVISGVSVGDVSTSTATIIWTTSTSTTGLVRYGTSAGALLSSASDAATSTGHSVTLTGLSPDTEHFFRVESTDANGNTATDPDGGDPHSFTTLDVDSGDGDAKNEGEGDNDGGEKRKAFVGVVTGIATSTTSTTVTLTRNGTGESVTVTLDGSEDYKYPGGPRAGSFEEGARVVILTRLVDGDRVAKKVLVKPVKPDIPTSGVVVSVVDGEVTVTGPNGTTQTFTLPDGAEEPVEGDWVTVFRGQSGKEKGLVKASKVQERLERFLEKLTAKADDLPDAAINARARLVSDLAAVLENYTSRQADIIESLSQDGDLPAKAVKGVEKALEKARRAQEKGKAVAKDARSKAGPPSGSRGSIFGPGKPGKGGDDEGDGGEAPSDQGPQAGEQGSQGSKGNNKGGQGAKKGANGSKNGQRGKNGG